MNDACNSAPTRVDLAVSEAADGTARVGGYACVFDRWATLHSDERVEYRELIERGAFTVAPGKRRRGRLRERDRTRDIDSGPIQVLRDFDPEKVLAEGGAGTLVLTDDERGVRVAFRPPGLRPGVEVRELVRDGSAALSLAYRIREGGERRTVREEDGRTIHESVVTAADLVAVGFMTPDALRLPGTFLRRRGMIPPGEVRRIVMQALDERFAAAEAIQREAEGRARDREAEAHRRRAEMAEGCGIGGWDRG